MLEKDYTFKGILLKPNIFCLNISSRFSVLTSGESDENKINLRLHGILTANKRSASSRCSSCVARMWCARYCKRYIAETGPRIDACIHRVCLSHWFDLKGRTMFIDASWTIIFIIHTTLLYLTAMFDSFERIRWALNPVLKVIVKMQYSKLAIRINVENRLGLV